MGSVWWFWVFGWRYWLVFLWNPRFGDSEGGGFCVWCYWIFLGILVGFSSVWWFRFVGVFSVLRFEINGVNFFVFVYLSSFELLNCLGICLRIFVPSSEVWDLCKVVTELMCVISAYCGYILFWACKLRLAILILWLKFCILFGCIWYELPWKYCNFLLECFD